MSKKNGKIREHPCMHTQGRIAVAAIPFCSSSNHEMDDESKRSHKHQ